jgi:hypothetical protein
MLKASACVLLLSFALFVSSAVSQQTATPATAAVPKLINFSGTLTDLNGKPLTGVQGVTFLLYTTQQGGNPLWMETQNITPERNGHYTATLGVTRAQGLPADIFSSGEARWLAVQVVGQPEQPRVLIVAVPYALKAADAQTVGGLPPSAFMLAVPPSGTGAPVTDSTTTSASVQPPVTSNVTTTGGAVNAVPLFTTATNIQNSIMTQTGTTALNIAGKLNLPATGTATSTGGKISQRETWVASSFNSSTLAAVNQTFQLQAEPTGNNTATPSGTLNLLFGSGTATPAETGLKISNKGIITFAGGQTFPRTGTVTSVGLSAPASDFTVSGSPVTKLGTLNLAWNVAPTNLDTANAIVKRDSTGSFDATNINASGQITVNNGTSLNPINVTATAANAAAIVGGSRGTGLTDGVLGASFSSGTGSSGAIGLDQNSNGSVGSYTTGVTGVTQNSYGVGVLGYGVFSTNGQSDIGFYRAGVWGDDQSGAGVVATSDTGNAAIAVNTSATSITLLAQNNTSASNGVIFRAAAPQVQSNGSSAFCQVTTHGDMGCTGDVYQNNPANGLVKALLFFDPGQPAGHLKIVRCFNSALTEPAASTPPCGFTYSNLDVGINQIDFGFPVTNRFPQITAGIEVGVNNFNGVIGVFYFPVGGASSQLEVWTILGSSNNRIDAPFSLSIF